MKIKWGIPTFIRWDGYMLFWSRIMKSSYEAQAVLGLPVVIYKGELDKGIIDHETIHTRQLYEGLIVGFWFIYGAQWLYHRVVMGMSADDAYMTICFEIEARETKKDPDYLNNRKPYAWIKYL